MSNQDLLNALNECIDRLASGQSVEDCLRAYPRYAAELEAMLRAGQLARAIQPHRDEIQEAQDNVRWLFEKSLAAPLPRRRPYPFQRLASIAAVLILLFGIIGGGTAYIARDALPGDSLYAFKRLVEDIRLLFSSEDGTLENEFNVRRIDETRDLIRLRREASVTFEGIVETITATEMQVAGLRVQIEPDRIRNLSDIMRGDQVEVQANTTRDGRLLARAIRIITRRQDVPRELPTPVPERNTTISPTERPSRTPEPTNSPTLRPSRTPTLQRPTATPTQVPTRRPLPSATPEMRPLPTDPPPPTDAPRPTENPPDSGGDGRPRS